MDFPDRSFIITHLQQSADVALLTVWNCATPIATAADMIANAFERGGKLLLCGNGGSAADCQHLATEFTCRLSSDFPRGPLAALALTTDTSFLTAYSNDFDFTGVFARQVQALGRPDDVLLAISTSGNSPNIVRAVEAAHTLGIRTIALTGQNGTLKGLADLAICVPSDSPMHVQEVHLCIEHILCAIVERRLFSKPQSDAPANGHPAPVPAGR
ncbi:MAG TPA: SIS domain-containing protein [Planctomycetaceae bacterium]|jgi:D-sedoheptulose 7-phosphate isomerase